jgi:DNA topoisomerase-3
MNCPICGEELIQNDKALGCSGWQKGCGFSIWNTVSGHALTEKEKEDLVQNGITDEIGDFKSRDGKCFRARLKLDEEGKVIFAFPGRAAGDLVRKCPVCGKAVYRSKKVWCCTDRECSFVIFDSLAGHFFTEEEKEALFEGKQIGPISDFINRNGKNFTAFVELGKDGKAQFVFGKRDDGDEGANAGNGSTQ